MSLLLRHRLNIFTGDSAYGLAPWLMKVFQDPNAQNGEAVYNRKIREVRQIIERVIGILKMRFRCLNIERVPRYAPTKVGYFVYSCAFLHNFLILNNFHIMRDVDEGELNQFIMERRNNNENAINQMMEGIGRRNELVQFFNR